MSQADTASPDDTAIGALAREGNAAVIADVMDQLGHLNHCLSPGIAPMVPGMRIVGRAMPVIYAEVYEAPQRPFGLLTQALDQLAPGEVWIGTGCSRPSAMWGELLTATAKARGAAGAVVDGHHRDTAKVLEQDWPVFSRGSHPADSAPRNRVVAYRTTVIENGVTIVPGDLVFADQDGVVVIPRRLEAEVIPRALAKVRAEKQVRRAIEGGMSCTKALETYGVL